MDEPVSVELDDEGQGSKELDIALGAGHQARRQLPSLIRGLNPLEGLFEDGDGLWGVWLVECSDPLCKVVMKLARLSWTATVWMSNGKVLRGFAAYPLHFFQAFRFW